MAVKTGMTQRRLGVAWRAAVVGLCLVGAASWAEAACPRMPWLLGAAEAYNRDAGVTDLRTVSKALLPDLVRGTGIVLVVTILAMAMIFGPVDALRKMLGGRASLARPSAFPSGRRHYVQMGSLGVPVEFEWDFPHLIMGGERFDMALARPVKGAGDVWEMADGTRVVFVLKSEVEAERKRKEQEHRAARKSVAAWRRFDDEGDPGGQPGH